MMGWRWCRRETPAPPASWTCDAVSLMIITKVDKGLPDALLLLVDVDDVLVGGVGLRERIKLVHLLDVPGEEGEDDGKGNEDDVSNLQRAVNSAGIS